MPLAIMLLIRAVRALRTTVRLLLDVKLLRSLPWAYIRRLPFRNAWIGIVTLTLVVSTAASEAVTKAGATLQASLRNELTYSAIGAVVGILVLLIITQRIVDSEPLSARLIKGPLPLTQWIAIGRCLRRFHDAGVCHADLNAHNILLTPAQVYLIDFDRGTLRKRGWWADTTLVRLYRSLEKVTLLAAPESFTDQDWHSLLAGYRESAGLPQASII